MPVRHIRSWLLASVLAAPAIAQTTTAFTYQGSLLLQGEPYTGDADYRFSLWATETGGNAPVAWLIENGVGVEAGLFTAALDFGAWPFTGERWLEIAVRTPAWDGVGDEPAFTTLPQRQRVTASPYSVQTRGIFVNETGDRVGLGTNQPLAPMHIVSPQGLLLGANPTSGGHTTLSVGLSGATNGFARLRATRASGAEWGNIVLNDAGGNVGIGTTNPQAKLHVQGDAIVSSTLRANAGVTFPSGAKISDVRFYGPFSIDPGPIPPGGLYAQFLSAPGVVPGDFAVAANVYNTNFLLDTVQVSSPNVILVTWRNISGATNDPPASDVSFLVFKP